MGLAVAGAAAGGGGGHAAATFALGGLDTVAVVDMRWSGLGPGSRTQSSSSKMSKRGVLHGLVAEEMRRGQTSESMGR